MNRTRSFFVIIIVSLFVLTVIGMNLAMPTDTHAHPAYGFTPPAPPPPDGGGDDGGGGDKGRDDNDGDNSGSGSGDNELPPDYILVELDRCDLSCSVEYESKVAGQAYPLLSPPKVRVQVQLIHQGSGWIAEGIISDAGSTRFSVPYPGQWEIFMIGEPEFIGPAAFDAAALNLDQLSTDLTIAPVSLGMVEANTAQPQLVKCPIACVIDSPPETLPTTGSDQSRAVLIILTNIAFLVLVGLSMYLAYKKNDGLKRSDHLIE